MRVHREQSVCEWAGVVPSPPAPGSKLGIALGSIGSQLIHGMREAATETTSGWYISCGGELSDAPDFFSPMHVEHIGKYLPQVKEYLDLPPGYRFLIDGSNHEDVWFDPQLLSKQPYAGRFWRLTMR